MENIALKAPAGIGSVKAPNGVEYFTNADGYVTVPVDQAAALIGGGFQQRANGLQFQYESGNLGDTLEIGVNFQGAGIAATRDGDGMIQVTVNGGENDITPFGANYGGQTITMNGTETVPADWSVFATFQSTPDIQGSHGAIELDTVGNYEITLRAQVVLPQPGGSTHWPDGITVYGTKLATLGDLDGSQAPTQSAHVFSLAAENAAVVSLSWTDTYVVAVIADPVILNPGVYVNNVSHGSAVATARLSISARRLPPPA